MNFADNIGGVVCSIVDAELSISGHKCILVGNLAHSGGVVYACESKIDVDCQFLVMANNTATTLGGPGSILTRN